MFTGLADSELPYRTLGDTERSRSPGQSGCERSRREPRLMTRVASQDGLGRGFRQRTESSGARTETRKRKPEMHNIFYIIGVVVVVLIVLSLVGIA